MQRRESSQTEAWKIWREALKTAEAVIRTPTEIHICPKIQDAEVKFSSLAAIHPWAEIVLPNEGPHRWNERSFIRQDKEISKTELAHVGLSQRPNK